ARVSQRQRIAVANLALIGNGATFALDSANNQIGTLAANVGAIGNGVVRFRSDNSFAIGMGAGTAGITADTVALTSSGTVTQNAGAPITAANLALINNATFTLTNAANQIATLAVNNFMPLSSATPGAVSVTSNSGLTIGTVVAGGLSGTVTGVKTGALTITSTGAVDQFSNANERIAVNTLSLLGSGGVFGLNNNTNA